MFKPINKKVANRMLKELRERLQQEAELWEQLAERLSDPTTCPMPQGLCFELSRAYLDLYLSDWRLGHDASERLRGYVRDHLDLKWLTEGPPVDSMLGYVYPRGEEREARILACLWMAREARAGVMA